VNPEPDLIDRIANALPAELRADYYREIRHCRSLPENDEMLRILRVMQFLVVLMVDVPERITTERRGFEQNIDEAIKALEKIRQSSATHQAQLDQRLSQLPKTIAEGIKPEAIVSTINESLRQQFVKSTIPETADALAVSAAQIKKSTAEFGPAASTLGKSRIDMRRCYSEDSERGARVGACLPRGISMVSVCADEPGPVSWHRNRHVV
jgi:hypothetical protein